MHGQADDQPLAVELYPLNAPPTPGTGQQFYYHADGEGSIRLLTDAQGQVANRCDYDSFGRRLSVVESLAYQPYGWKGREWIAGVDIYYNRARFYDPVLGRFLAQDPLGYGAGDFNLYSFAWNNPKNWNDPSGKSVEVIGISGIALAAAGYLNTPAGKNAVVKPIVNGIACGINYSLSWLAAKMNSEEIADTDNQCVSPLSYS